MYHSPAPDSSSQYKPRRQAFAPLRTLVATALVAILLDLMLR